MLGGKSQALAALREKVAAFETRPALAEVDEPTSLSSFLSTRHGMVHEVFTDNLVNAGAALGFALGHAREAIRPSRPGVLFMQLRSDTKETGLPYGMGLTSFGYEPEALVLIRADTVIELLWAMEEAIACRAIAAVVTDVSSHQKALDFTTSRRLALRTAASGADAYLMRYGLGREASAARFRWKVAPSLSGPTAYDNKAPGPPRWRIVLEKGSLGKSRNAAPEGQEFLVDWTENGFAPASVDKRSAHAAVRSALPHAAPAALGNRLSKAG